MLFSQRGILMSLSASQINVLIFLPPPTVSISHTILFDAFSFKLASSLLNILASTWFQVYWCIFRYLLFLYFSFLFYFFSWQQLSYLCSNHCLIQFINTNYWSVYSLTHKYLKISDIRHKNNIKIMISKCIYLNHAVTSMEPQVELFFTGWGEMY